ncbi:MAG: hypothetical protein MUF15_07290 [Acidobacteria bacterium]|nr:hypothetical protein [Acidobacteriota bacterium]
MMSTVENITVSEFKDLLNHVKLPEKTRLTVTFDDNQMTLEILKKKRALEAIHKLRGSGNGNLVKTLLKERAKDKLR